VFNRIVTNDPVMWAYVHPDFLRRFDRETHTAPEDAINREFRRLADSVEGIGCSFRWNERLQLQLTFAMEPGSAGLLAGLSSPNARDTSQIELRLSPRTVMIARGFFDFPAAYEAFLGLLEKSDPAASVAMNELLKGFLRGEDPKTRILPHVGPEVVVGIEAPASGETRCPWVVAVPLRGDQEVERAVENAIATVMAAAALDTKTTPRARFETRQVNGGSLRVLDREGRTLGVAIQSDQFAAGSPAERVAEWLGVDGGASEQSRAWAILGRGSSASIVADLVAIETAISTNRAALIERMIKIEGRNEKDAARDLDQASAMIRLFRAGALELDWAPKDAMLELRVSLQSR
jgi:hypothetical protein